MIQPCCRMTIGANCELPIPGHDCRPFSRAFGDSSNPGKLLASCGSNGLVALSAVCCLLAAVCWLLGLLCPMMAQHSGQAKRQAPPLPAEVEG
jgi:hypothetical protein